jgi:hypothetical protein
LLIRKPPPVHAGVMSDDCECSKFIDPKSEDIMTVIAELWPKERGVFPRPLSVW